MGNEGRALRAWSMWPGEFMNAIMERMGEDVWGEDESHLSITAAGADEMIRRELSERERLVIEQRYRHGRSLSEIAREFDVTRERARQIELRAIRRLASMEVLKKYVSVPYYLYAEEVERRETAEKRLDWFLEHGTYRAELSMASEEESKKIVERERLLTRRLADLLFTARTYNCLRRHGVETLRDLLAMDRKEYLSIRSFGVGCLDEVEGRLHLMGLKMKWETDDEGEAV